MEASVAVQLGRGQRGLVDTLSDAQMERVMVTPTVNVRVVLQHRLLFAGGRMRRGSI